MDIKMSEKTSLTSEKKEDSKLCFKVCKHVRQRWIHGLHILLGMTCYGLIIRSISMTIIPMTDVDYSAPSGVNQTTYSSNSKINGLIYGIEFVGSGLTVLFSSLVIEKYPSLAKWTFCLCILCPGISLFFYPTFASIDMRILITVRLVNGLFFGCLFGINVCVIIYWAPVQELTAFLMLSSTGPQLGSFLVQITSGFIVDYFNWQAVFYFVGAFSVISAIYLFIFLNIQPSDCSLITKRELDYITANRKSKTGSADLKRVPWKDIVTSLPVWAIILCGIADLWLRLGLYYDVPVYLNNISNFYMHDVGLVISAILLISTIFGQLVAIFSDKIISKYENSRLCVRKCVTFIGGLGQCICCIALTFFTGFENVVLLSLSYGIFHSTFSVPYHVNILEIAPFHGNILLGLTFCIEFIIAAFSPILTGCIVTSKEVTLWNTVFYIYAGIVFLATLFFCIFGKAEIQSWSAPESPEYDNIDASKEN